MRLTFFEKELFDQESFEKPTIAINSINPDQRSSVQKIKTKLSDGSFESEPKNKVIRKINIPAEVLNFYTNGAKFTGSFKHTKLTSGEPEIVSRTTAPQVTKPINVSFKNTIRLRALEERETERETTDVTLPSSDNSARSYEPYLVFRLGRAVRLVISNGFSDINRFVRNYTSNTISNLVTAYSNFLRFLQGDFNSGFYNNNKSIISIDQATSDIVLPNELLRKEETTPINQVITYNTTRQYPIFINPISETQYWRFTGNIKNTFSIKNISLRGSSVNTSLVLPTNQTISYDGFSSEWVNQDGTSRLNGASNEYLTIIPPILSITNLSYVYRSAVSSTTTSVREQGRTSYFRFFSHLSVREYTLSGYDSFFNNIPRGTLFQNGIAFISFNSANSSLTLGGSDTGYFDSLLRRIISFTRPSITISLPKNKFVIYLFRDMLRASSNTRSSLPSNSDIKSIWDRQSNQKLDGTTDANLRQINTDIQRLRNASIPTEVRGYDIRPLLETDFTSPTGKVTNSELGFANNTIDINNVRQTGTLLATPTPASHTTTSHLNTNGTRQKNYYYNLTGALRVDNIPLITNNNFNNDTQSGTTELKQRLPIYLPSINNNTYQIVDVNFVTNEIAIQKNEGETIRSNELSVLGIENASGVVTEYPLSLGRSSRFNNIQVYYYRNEELVNLFRPVFSNTITRVLSIFNGVSLPTIRNFIDNRLLSIGVIRNLFTSQTKQLKFFIASGQVLSTETETNQNQDLLESKSQAFPHIRLNNILYNTEQNRLYLILSRGENSPVPDKNYFSSVKINNRSFNFGSSRYNAYNNPSTSPYGIKGAEYSWSYGTNLLTAGTIPIEFKKSGTSVTNSIDESRLVRKSTINTKDKKVFTDIISSLWLQDVGFTSTSFYIEFKGSISNTNFQTIALKNSENTDYITRQLLLSEATRTESQGNTKFTWNDKPEFAILNYNKEYTIEIIKGANIQRKQLFIPIQNKDNFDFVNNYKQTAGQISFELQRNHFKEDITNSFIAFGLLKESDNRVISGAWFNNNQFTYDNEFSISNNTIPELPSVNEKVLLSFQIEDRPATEISLIKLTDIFADTFVILDTNINDLGFYDIDNNPLAHPSEFEEIKEVKEGDLRHCFIKLKQPITTKQLNLIVRKTSDDTNTIKINRLLVLKKIGQFSQFPKVQVNTSTNKRGVVSAINTSHITSKPLSLNYNFQFPPLDKLNDLKLAQDLFTRTNEYNEFIVWLSGGDIAPKITDLVGYRFIDLVKSLAINDFQVKYVDDRFSSGIDFSLDTRQVSTLNI